MHRKQNSLMRFSRTERLAQLSEQEIVIEKKKKEIQAKLEAQKKKETEEAFKKSEFPKDTKNTKQGFSKLSWSGTEGKKNYNREKSVEKVKETLTNAFSNDGTFLDQFKKLSESKISSSYEAQTPSMGKKSDIKSFSYSSQEGLNAKDSNRKKEVENDRNTSETLENIKKEPPDNNQSSFITNSSVSGVQLQTPGVLQFSQHQEVSGLSAIDNSKKKSTVPLLPTQISQIKASEKHPISESYSNNMSLNSNQFIYSSSTCSTQPVQHPKLCQSFDPKGISANGSSNKTLSPTPILSSGSFQNISGPSPVLSFSEPSELPKVRSESISMTLKMNPVKKLEAIPNPLEIDQELSPDSLNKNQFSFSEKESLKKTLNVSQNFRSIPIIGNASSPALESFRVSSAFCNEDDDGSNGNIEGDKTQVGAILNEKQQHWAALVARFGDEYEDLLLNQNGNAPDIGFLSNKNSKEYLSYRRLVLKYREHSKSKEDSSEKSRTLLESGGHSDIMKPLKVHEDDFSKHECGNMLESTFKGQCFSNSQKQSLSKGFSSQICEEKNVGDCEQMKTEERRKRKRKSRWGDAEPSTSTPGMETNLNLHLTRNLPAPKSTLLSQLTRSDPGLIQYAKQTFGSTNLSEEDWKKAEDHYKINLLYQDMIKKRAEVEKLEKQGKFKYEYDSDEDTEGGTWEHKLRQQEMQATQLWAEELTRQAAGKHHIGDFLPPEELERFMEKYNAVKEGREPDLSDYKEYKLKEDNVGYRLLQKMGWNEGQGLGQDGTGITNPVNKGATRHENQGLGAERPDGLEAGDDEYDAYRKRMMLAYRFRPNPLNNPRRPYY